MGELAGLAKSQRSGLFSSKATGCRRARSQNPRLRNKETALVLSEQICNPVFRKPLFRESICWLGKYSYDLKFVCTHVFSPSVYMCVQPCIYMTIHTHTRKTPPFTIPHLPIYPFTVCTCVYNRENDTFSLGGVFQQT